jgi:hypothetical protein
MAALGSIHTATDRVSIQPMGGGALFGEGRAIVLCRQTK